jgi:hypothetical protein
LWRKLHQHSAGQKRECSGAAAIKQPESDADTNAYTDTHSDANSSTGSGRRLHGDIH